MTLYTLNISLLYVIVISAPQAYIKQAMLKKLWIIRFELLFQESLVHFCGLYAIIR